MPRTLSVAARKRIAEAQRARWAKVRGETANANHSSPVVTARKPARSASAKTTFSIDSYKAGVKDGFKLAKEVA